MRQTKRAWKQMGRTARQGFTLIEVMLVVVIIGLLAGIVSVSIPKNLEKGRKTKAKADIAGIGTAITTFYMETGKYPANLDSLVQGDEPYLEKGIPRDPWGNDYQYTFPGTHKPFKYDLKSLGPDGIDSDDDIANWKPDTVPADVK